MTEDTGEPPPMKDANPAAAENKAPAGTTAPDKPAAGGGGSGGGGGDDPPSKLTSIYNSTTSFMGLVGKEWLSSLLSQPADPPFTFDAKFADGPVRIMRLVVMSVFLTGPFLLWSAAFTSTKRTESEGSSRWDRSFFPSSMFLCHGFPYSLFCGASLWAEGNECCWGFSCSTCRLPTSSLIS